MLSPFPRLLILAVGLNCFTLAPLGARNPAIDAPHPINADPSAHVWSDGKMYVYVTQGDESWRVYESENLVDWTGHDIGFGLADTGWAKIRAWAPDAMEKDGRFYLYYPGHYGDRKNGGMHTGVAVSDSPTGPFVEALGQPLLRGAYDPAVFRDDDGICYLYAQMKVVRLGDDMIRLAEEPRTIEVIGHDLPARKEAAFVFKKDGVYYWTISENWNTLLYYTGDNPYGPFTYGGMLMDAYGENNQHSIVEYKGHWLLFYHRWLQTETGENKRRTCIEEMRFNPDGSIQTLVSTDLGFDVLDQVPSRRPMEDLWYEPGPFVGYLFAHMTTDDYGHLYYALSRDGLNFERLNEGKRINEDYQGHPYITHGHDGRYYLIGGGNPITFWVSEDLVTWEKYSEAAPDVKRTHDFKPGLENRGAAKVFWDEATGLYMVTWQTSLFPRRRNYPGIDERYWGGQRALYSLSRDLKSFSDPLQLFPNHELPAIDIFVTRLGGKYYCVYKDERYPSYDWPHGKAIRIASSDRLTGLYDYPGPRISGNFREAPSIVPKLDGTGYYMYFERYPGNQYEIATSDTMEGPWIDIYKMEISIPEDTRHGVVFPVTQAQWDAITAAYAE